MCLCFQIEDLETSITCFLLFPFLFQKVEKLNISAVYEATTYLFLWIFLWYLSTSFWEEKIEILPPGEPREHHLGEVQKKKFIYTKLHKGRVDRLWRISDVPENIDPSGHFVFYEILCSSNFCNPFYSFLIILSVNLPMVCIYNFCKKDIQIKPPGETQEQRIGEVRLEMSNLKFDMV